MVGSQQLSIFVLYSGTSKYAEVKHYSKVNTLYILANCVLFREVTYPSYGVFIMRCSTVYH